MKETYFARWLPVILWAIIIFFTSANPNPYRPLPASWSSQSVPAQVEPGSKRINSTELLGRYLHATEYLVLAVLIARALVWRGDLRLVSLTTAFVLSALYAFSDEIHQFYVPGRAFEWGDLALDLGGAAFGLVTYALIITLWRRRVK